MLSTQHYGLSYILVQYFNVTSLQVWVNASQRNKICNPTDPSDFQKSERCSRFTWLFMPQSTMEGLVNHNVAICVSQDVEANIHSGSQFSTQPSSSLAGRSRITTPSKQGSPTGRPPFCQEQGRVSLPPSHWLLAVLLASDWQSPAPGLGWTRRLRWTRARDRVCRVGGGTRAGNACHAC